jgi:uncharacterized YkwD family protein
MEVKTMKKKIIAVMAAVLLLGISSVAYAAPATYCPTGTQVRMDLSNFIETLQNCGGSNVLNLSDCDNAAANDCLNVVDCKVPDSCKDSNASNNTNTCTGTAKNSVSSAKNALESIKNQASYGNNIVDSVIAGSGRTNSRLNTAITELLKKLIANSNCFNTEKPIPTPVVTTTPVPTDKPVETPVATAKPTAEPTATLAPTAKPTATPVITQTPEATAKPTAVPTAKPTAAPTAVPTAKPTVKPTIPQGSDNLAFEKRVVELVNEQRALNGLAPLTLSSKLSDVARAKSQDMHDNRYFSHTSPTYGSPFDMMKAFGISYRTAGENIAMGYSSPESVMDGWMNSPGHRANILNASYTTIGVGYVADGNYWTQHFTG